MQPPSFRSKRRGSALLLALLVLLILLAIMAQLVFGTKSDADVARNDIALTTMDLAIESSLLEVFDRLKTDGESAGSGAGSGAAPTDAGAAATPGATPNPAGGAGGEQQGSVDSHEDPWGRPQRTTINEIELRVVVQDEDSKLNVLGMLATNQAEAEKCFDRVQRTIDAFREGTDSDIDPSSARTMTEAMRDYMKDRSRQVLPKPHLLSDDEKLPDQGLAISLDEFAVLEPFDESMFRDYREPDGRIVHSLGSFLTTWTSLSAGSTGGGGAGAAAAPSGGANDPAAGGANSGGQAGEGGDQPPGEGGEVGDAGGDTGGANSGQAGDAGGGAQGGANPGGGQTSAASKYGVAVNVNTAPPALLKSLIDDRDIPSRFWDKVIEYRNLEEEPEETDTSTTASEPEPVYDEYGEEVIQRQVFDSLDELREVDGYENLDGAARAQLDQLLTTESQVFTILITARKSTGIEDPTRGGMRDPEEREDLIANTLTRTVRCVVWRRKSGENVSIVPLVRWEVVDYMPLVVEDFPDDRR
ncbi:MAG: general secretion pathway protein GspK [Planctomycetes bacterium]|nr:general secretion pathway protein GspK [Planctomycetota bacterium]